MNIRVISFAKSLISRFRNRVRVSHSLNTGRTNVSVSPVGRFRNPRVRTSVGKSIKVGSLGRVRVSSGRGGIRTTYSVSPRIGGIRVSYSMGSGIGRVPRTRYSVPRVRTTRIRTGYSSPRIRCSVPSVRIPRTRTSIPRVRVRSLGVRRSYSAPRIRVGSSGYRRSRYY